ncbi:MAG TPA: ABC transporter substrate-binding protein, partial [Candidatus Saccharimonadales bacterium]|nr:ABC transporter substrate-binding protein [Candidatus Saccharimonadales bacterium]
PRIGYLTTGSPSTASSQIEAFRQGLRELGYEEGKNITIVYKYAEGRSERLQMLANELVRLEVDIIVAPGTPAVQAAKQATASIPIVFPGVADPVAFGFVASLARPGGNLTGLTNFSPQLSGKRVELLKEALPRISRVAVLRDPRLPPDSFIETEKASQALALKLQSLEIRNAADVEAVFSTLSRERAEALITLPHSIFNFHRSRILELVAKNRLPSTFGDKEWVEAGGLMSYGPDTMDIRRLAAKYVDKILKGAKPADLPVEQPTKFEFVINLQTAKQIGLTILPNVLARADRVIK